MSIDKTDNSLYAALGLQRPDDKLKGTGGKEPGQQEFLQLMIAQLNNQDPFKPLDSKDFLSQMAQFSTVSGINELQHSFGEFAANMRSNQALQASSLVGRTVLVPSANGVLGAEHPLVGAMDLPSQARNVQVQIHDSTGQLVRELSLGDQPAGMAPFVWDGVNQSGQALPAGTYRISATANLDGENQNVETLVYAPVESVTLGTGGRGMTLNLGLLGSATMDKVRQIL